jgi:uncharacterized protein
MGLGARAWLELDEGLPVVTPGSRVDVVDDEEDLRLVGPGVDVVEDFGDAADMQRSGACPPLLDQLPLEGGDRRLPGLDLAAGQLEQARAVRCSIGSALHEDPTRIEPDEAGCHEQARVERHAPGISLSLRTAAQALCCAHPMRLFSSKIPHITEAVTRALVDPGDIEISDRDEFKRDVESILREYLRKEREITEQAKDLLESRGLPYSDLYKTKRALAEREDFAIGDESVNWIANQLLELFMQSQFVEEIYADDAKLRRSIKEVLRKNMQADEDLDREVRRHLKHLTEGTDSFEIEYQKQLELIKRKHGLS